MNPETSDERTAEDSMLAEMFDEPQERVFSRAMQYGMDVEGMDVAPDRLEDHPFVGGLTHANLERAARSIMDTDVSTRAGDELELYSPHHFYSPPRAIDLGPDGLRAGPNHPFTEFVLKLYQKGIVDHGMTVHGPPELEAIFRSYCSYDHTFVRDTTKLFAYRKNPKLNY